jgi:hypothetical protein
MRIPLSRGQEAVVDAADYPLVSAFKWHAQPTTTKQWYAVTRTTNAAGRPSTLYMHRLITGAPKGKEVDHINRDTLDNRRVNLRVGTHRDNMRNGRFALARHCPKGHPYDAKNTYFDGRGRRCRTCATLRQRDVLAGETSEAREARRRRVAAYYQRIKATPENRVKQREACRRWREKQKAKR